MFFVLSTLLIDSNDCIQNANPEQFSLVEVVLDKGVSERELSQDDKPFLMMQKSRKVGISFQ